MVAAVPTFPGFDPTVTAGHFKVTEYSAIDQCVVFRGFCCTRFLIFSGLAYVSRFGVLVNRRFFLGHCALAKVTFQGVGLVFSKFFDISTIFNSYPGLH